MADLSLSALPGATPIPVPAPGTVVVESAKEGTTPFASLLTTLGDPTAPAAKAPAPLLAGAAVPTLATLAVAIDPAFLVASADTRAPEADVDGKAIVDATANGPASTLAPDLSAFLALIAPPPRIAAVIVRATAPQGGTPADSTNTAALPVAPAPTATVITPAAPIASSPMQDIPAPRDSTAPTPLGAPTVRTPEPTAVATIATAAAAIFGTPPIVAIIAPANEGPLPLPSSAPSAGQATAPAAAAPAAQTADPIATGGTSLLASPPIALTDPAMPAGTTRASLTVRAAAAPAVPIVRIDLGLAAASADTSDVQADGDGAATPDTGTGDPTAAPASDLAAVLAAVALPPQIAPIVVQAVKLRSGPSSDGANRTGGTVAPAIAAGIPMQPVPTASFSTREATATSSDAPAARAEPATTGQTAIAPDRMAQALAAVRAMAPRSPDPAAASPAATTSAAIVGTASEAAPSPAATSTAPAPASANGSPTTGPANAAPIPQSSAMPDAGQPTTPATAPTLTAGPIQDAAPLQELETAPRAPAAIVSPAGTAGIRRADPVPAAAVARAAAPSETQRPAPARARKVADIAQIDVRTDVAPARPDVPAATQAAPTPLADDPVARQLSMAQDGQWLDALAKDIAGAGDTNGQLNFRLDPDHLGSLTVQLTQTADGASVRLTASTEAARTILADAQPRLVAEARAQGLTLREATVETRTAAPTPAAPADAGFSGSAGGNGRSDQGGVAGQLHQQSQQQGGSRQRAPDQPRQAASPAPRAPASTRSGADLYA